MAGKHLSWNEIRSRALEFSKEWADAEYERGQAQTFWNEFFNVFGITRKRVASFETNVKKIDGRGGFIDLLWKGVLLIEHKSRGKDLDRAHSQAIDYFPGLKEHELPRYIMVSDFARFRLNDLEEGETFEFNLEDFHKNVNLFGFIAGYQTRKIKPQDPVNIKAAEKMGKLHDQMKAVGYEGHALEIYLVRLLFCLYAEDTSIFEKQQFTAYIEDKTNEDGSDLASHLSQLFEVLNTLEDMRLKNLDEHLAAFPYINGKLFEERLPHAGFDTAMRNSLLECCTLNWGRISPAIFGSLFQSIMDKDARRNLGAHYTGEENILKLINPLFMDELNEEFDRISKLARNTRQLNELHNRIQSLKFLDPACGCGNFLIIAYRELRLLELKILSELNKHGELLLNVGDLIQVDVDQFYGIEIEEFPAQIAQVAMWLMDHQMNLKVSEELGQYYARLPLKKSATIVNENALQIDWEDIIPRLELNYILGNPPFIGYAYMTDEQKVDRTNICGHIDNYGLLDYVANWFIIAAVMITKNPRIKTAFVSTNSISMGEQVGVLWGWLSSKGITIDFAHRTFAWTSEGRGKAAVHCVIEGFSIGDKQTKRLFEYEHIGGEPLEKKVGNINPYLVDARNLTIQRRNRSICDVPPLSMGSKPVEGGYYLFDDNEKVDFIRLEPDSERLFRRWLGAREFINRQNRWCLWLGECTPNELRSMPEVMKRISAVKDYRKKSRKVATQRLAEKPTHFEVENIPKGTYLLIPEVSSERRIYIPVGFEDESTICSNKVRMLPNANLYHFGIVTSIMHNAWVRAVTGRLKSDYQYSVNIVYNNFPWPKDPSEAKIKKIEEYTQFVLDTREKYTDSSLADLYDPLTMPPDLLRAHQTLDKAVDSAYGRTAFKSEAERVSFLFDLYQEYVRD